MRVAFIILLLSCPLFSFSQKLKPQVIKRLSKELSESSGIVKIDSNLQWTINDGGGRNQLYNAYRRIANVYIISNVTNVDWEDLALDSTNIFVGDFGNNIQVRLNLRVYKVKRNPGIHYFIDDSFSPLADSGSVISFHYPDQKQFPPPPANWNFDCEAFFHKGDSLYLFSKNLSNPDDGYTKMYRLPDQPGDYTAELIDSFYLNEPVTSADISADGKTVVLLTYFSLWVFKDFPENNFFEGKVFQFPFRGFTQKEAICFANDHELLMTDERHFGIGGKLYKTDLNQLDFSKPARKFKVPFCKRAIYNFYNNPKVKYKKMMKQVRYQGGPGNPRF